MTSLMSLPFLVQFWAQHLFPRDRGFLSLPQPVCFFPSCSEFLLVPKGDGLSSLSHRSEHYFLRGNKEEGLRVSYCPCFGFSSPLLCSPPLLLFSFPRLKSFFGFSQPFFVLGGVCVHLGPWNLPNILPFFNRCPEADCPGKQVFWFCLQLTISL